MALALKHLAEARGVEFRTNCHVTRIETQDGRVAAVHTGDGRFPCTAAIFNGDPRALALGRLGQAARRAVPARPLERRSLSAQVWAFATDVHGADLVHHNVFFADDPKQEFDPISRGDTPPAPTIYICAEDRGTGLTPPAVERLELILNAAPLPATAPGGAPTAEEIEACRQRTLQTLAPFGLSFGTPPPDAALTLPQEWEARFHGSAGSLYGQSPHGMMAAFQRPTARTRVPGLYLVGGGTHPGAGVPMATLSAQHAAEAMLRDQISTSTSRQTATHGGMSTA
ncbi:MAG: FAD-dependent oxidoreductase, partial [Pseudomonadota bacterium]